MSLLNRVYVGVSNTPGNSSSFTLASAEANHQSFGAAGAVDGYSYSYVAEEGGVWETGTGTYSATGGFLSRDIIKDSSAGAGTKATFTSAVKVYVTALAGDIHKCDIGDLIYTYRNPGAGFVPAQAQATYLNSSYPAAAAILPPALTQTQQSNGFTSGNDVRDYAYNGSSVWVAVGGGGKIQRSTNAGVTWADATTPSFGSDSVLGVVWTGTRFVACGSSGKIAVSTDGDVWTQKTSGLSVSFLAVEYGNGILIAVGGSGGLARSTDNGDTWTNPTSAFGTTGINGLAYGAGRWITVGSSGVMATSTDDGANWSAIGTSSFAGTAINAVIYDTATTTWIAFGDSGKVGESTNGTTWAQRPTTLGLGTGNNLRSVAKSGSLWVVTGSSGFIAISLDNWSWYVITTTFSTSQVFTVVYGGSRFLLAGAAGKIATLVPDSTQFTVYPATPNGILKPYVRLL